MEELIKDYKEAQAKVNEIYFKLMAYNDGFRYLTRRTVFKYTTNEELTNDFATGDLMQHYIGENGMIEGFTTNPNPNPEFYRYHVIEVVSDEEYDILKTGTYGDRVKESEPEDDEEYVVVKHEE